MLPLVFPTVFPVSRVQAPPLPNSFSSYKPYRTAGKRSVERRRNIAACFFSPTKSSLAIPAETGIEGGDRIQEEVEGDVIPKHVALILDGHGRWGKKKGLTTQDGHKHGFINLKYTVSNCASLGIKHLTVYAFSTENWYRSKMEVEFLMKVFEDFIQSVVEELMPRHDIRLSVIGDKSRLPESLQNAISSAEEMSEANGGMQLAVALSYGGIDDAVQAAKSIATKVEHGILRASDVDQSVFEKQLMTGMVGLPSLDLMIRTGGELRLSNFLLLQAAYTELHFTHKSSPDFGMVDLLQAITSYQRRHRGYGVYHHDRTPSTHERSDALHAAPEQHTFDASNLADDGPGKEK